MRSTALVVCITLSFGAVLARAEAWQPPVGLAQIPIWPGNPPGPAPAAEPESLSKADKPVAGKEWWWVTNVSTPTMTIFPPKSRNTGAAVIVFPGGGFMGLAIDLEDTEVCDWLTSQGVTCVVLKYRVPRSEDYYDQKLGRHVEPKVFTAFQDAQRTISLVRSRASEWSIDPKKIGVLGFSAGGYLAAKTATEFNQRSYEAVDSADKESRRPDFSVPIYPGHLWRPDDGSDELKLSPRIHVTRQVPPTFLLMAEDDHVDHVEQVLVYYKAMKNAGVPVEMHLYAEGGHAFGLRPTKFPITRWPAMVESWLRTIGMIPASSVQGTALDAAVAKADLRASDPLEVKIEKTLGLLVNQQYFAPHGTPENPPPPYDQRYHLDSLRTPEQILNQKIGGYCNNYALVFSAMLERAGIASDDMRIVAAVNDDDLALICPKAGAARAEHPSTGASGHVFVAVKEDSGRWRLINTVGGAKSHESAPWPAPSVVEEKMRTGPLSVPREAASGAAYKPMTVFAVWRGGEEPLHTFDQRLDLIASGTVDGKLCRYGPR